MPDKNHPHQNVLKYRKKFGPSADAIIFRAAELFLSQQGEHLSAPKVAERIVREFKQSDLAKKKQVTHKDVFDLIRAAIELDIVVLRAPLKEELAKKLQKAFKLPHVNFQVVDAESHISEFLAQQAAEVLFDQIKLQMERKRSANGFVGVGMGPGDSTLSVCRKLARLLDNTLATEFLKIFGISSGCPPLKPSLAPISFFNLLPRHVIRDTMAFLTEPLIPVGEYEARKSKRGLCEVFQAQHEVDIVFTSMGDCHTHDELIQMLDLTSTEVTERELAGSVQYRLYTERGKYVEGPKEMRVATLFELDDLVQMASPDSGKSVVLIARPCTSHRCNARKTEALKPLLTVPSLRVFSHLILDTETAVELLAWKESLAGNGAPSTDQIQAPSEQNT